MANKKSLQNIWSCSLCRWWAEAQIFRPRDTLCVSLQITPLFGWIQLFSISQDWRKGDYFLKFDLLLIKKNVSCLYFLHRNYICYIQYLEMFIRKHIFFFSLLLPNSEFSMRLDIGLTSFYSRKHDKRHLPSFSDFQG